MKVSRLIKYCVMSLALVCVTCFSIGHASWVLGNEIAINQPVDIEVTDWTFGDGGFAKIENVSGLSNLTAEKEETLTRGSTEAIRFTNTAGTQSKDHVFNIDLGSDYNLYDIATCKIEFDLYHRYKREQYTKGFPKLQLYYNNTARGNAQGGDDTITEIAPYVVTRLDDADDWWHLEYFVVSLCPTMAGHQDKPQTNYTINRIRFVDRGVYDYAGTTGFMILDNLVITNAPAARLGIFNRTSGDSAGKFFWFKVAWSGDLHSCVLSSSDPTIAVPEFSADDVESTSAPFPNGSPFYFSLLRAGTVTLTATLEIGDNHIIQTISNTITVT